MSAITTYFKDIYLGIKTLLTGMRVTGYYFTHARKEIITQQYPENRDTLKMFEQGCCAGFSILWLLEQYFKEDAKKNSHESEVRGKVNIVNEMKKNKTDVSPYQGEICPTTGGQRGVE